MAPESLPWLLTINRVSNVIVRVADFGLQKSKHQAAAMMYQKIWASIYNRWDFCRLSLVARSWGALQL